MREFLAAKLPKIKLLQPESTYLVWLDFSEYGLSQEELDRRIFWFNDVGGGRFGGIAGVFFEKGDAFFESNDFFECGFE